MQETLEKQKLNFPVVYYFTWKLELVSICEWLLLAIRIISYE